MRSVSLGLASLLLSGVGAAKVDPLFESGLNR
jgi:hypothetical protein